MRRSEKRNEREERENVREDRDRKGKREPDRGRKKKRILANKSVRERDEETITCCRGREI